MCTLANSADTDEMPLYAAFHQCLNCFLRQKQSSEKEIQFFYLEIITCDPLIYTMDPPMLLYQTRRKNPLLHKGVNMECENYKNTSKFLKANFTLFYF